MFGSNALAAATEPCLAHPAKDQGKQDFLKLAEISPAMIWMVDAEGDCTFVNTSWLEFRGRTFAQETGSGWAEGLHPEDADLCMGEYMASIANRRQFRLAYRFQSRGGQYFQVENVTLPWNDEGGFGQGFVGSVSLVDREEEQFRTAARQLAYLSLRERQMLELIAGGYATKEAAGKLGISYKTADSHRSHLLKKLGLHETASVVRFAIRSGLVPV